MNVNPQWISAIAHCVTASGVILVVLQIWFAAKGLKVARENLLNSVSQLELHRDALDKTAEQISLARQSFFESHELERRKQAIIHMKDWSMFIAQTGTGAKNFAERLDFEKSKLLWEEESFKISKNHKDYLERTIAAIGPIQDCNGDEAQLSPAQSSLIRKQVVSYLNLLETILSARRHNVADNEMLGEQFGSLVVPRLGKQLLPNFRRIAGGVEAFPSIEEFVKEIEAKKNSIPPAKNKLGNAC